jgi:hypothetical protein
MTITSAYNFDRSSTFIDHILLAGKAKEYHEFIYNDVPPWWGEMVSVAIEDRFTHR